MRPWQTIIGAGLIAATLGACQVSQPPLSAKAHTGTAQIQAAALDDPEATLVREMALLAYASLGRADQTYMALGLHTAGGRRLTPKREPQLQAGLRPLVGRLEKDSRDIAERLGAIPSSRLGLLLAEFENRRPESKDLLEPSASATDLLARVALFRVKFGFLVEYSLRHGALSALPGRAPSLPVASEVPDQN